VTEAGGDGLRGQIEDFVVVATGRTVSREDLRACGGSLEAAGVNSIGYINLMEALERAFGLVLDPEEDPVHLASVDSIVELVVARRRPAGTPP
jgi:hypothetical protein